MGLMDKQFWIGVDLGQSSFWAAVTAPASEPKRWADLPAKEFPFTKGGLHAFCGWAKKLCGDAGAAGICAEALAPLAWKWMEQLNGRVAPVALVNPRYPKDFARSLGIKDKTDRIDACILAFFGRERNPEARPLPPKAWRQLHELSRLYAAKQQDLNACSNRLRGLDLPDAVLEEAQCEIKRMKSFLKRIEQAMLELIAEDEQMQQDFKRLQTIPGVAQLTALRVLAEMGDLRQYTRNEITALAGLYPRQYSSGTSVYRKPRLPKAGRLHLRAALYFPAMTAIRCCPTMADFVARLRKRGLNKKAVICAVMRKLLLLMRAIIIEQEDYNPKFPQQNSNEPITA
jgi:transposase